MQRTLSPLDSIFCAPSPPEKWTSTIGDPNAFHPTYYYNIHTKFDIYGPEDHETARNPLSKIRFTVLTRIFHV